MSSPVAYGDLDGIDTGYTEFAPYDGMTKDKVQLPTLKKSDGKESGTYTHKGDITYYIGGTYIPVDTLASRWIPSLLTRHRATRFMTVRNS